MYQYSAFNTRADGHKSVTIYVFVCMGRFDEVYLIGIRVYQTRVNNAVKKVD